jgi:hypothetical protein
MKTAAGVLFGVILVLTCCPSGHAMETGTCTCRDGIVSKGDLLAEVVKKCGPPTFQSQRQETRLDDTKESKTITTISIDDWTYNFGPNEFMYNLRFENGRVMKIESLDYGY